MTTTNTNQSQSHSLPYKYPPKSSETPYTITDSLSQRYPYTQPSFQDSLKSIEKRVFPSFGLGGLERNIAALRDDEFELSEKEKALRILYTQLFDTKLQIRCLQYDLIGSLHHLLKSRPSKQIDQLAARLCQRLCVMNQTRLQVIKQGLVPLLLNIIMDVNAALQERSEACKAIMKLAQSREGVNALLQVEPSAVRSPTPQETSESGTTQSNGGYSVVQALVWVLDVNTSQCNSQLLYLAEEALIEICRTPMGRAQTASSGALLALDAILSRPELGFECDDNDKLIQSSDLAITRNACHLVWNICLDGEGKKLGKAILPTLSYVLHLSIQVCELSLIRLITGAIMSILVYEPAKPVALEPIEVLNSKVCLVDILCQFLEFSSTHENFFNEQEQFVETDRLEYIRKNTITCIRLAAEWPASREKIHELLGESGLLSEVGL